jgi:hypothetical protein
MSNKSCMDNLLFFRSNRCKVFQYVLFVILRLFNYLLFYYLLVRTEK